jgi:hypothetical protein
MASPVWKSSQVVNGVPIDLKGAKCSIPQTYSGYAICGTFGRTPGRTAFLPAQEQYVHYCGVIWCMEKFFEKHFKICSAKQPFFLLYMRGYSMDTESRGFGKPIRKGGFYHSISHLVRAYQQKARKKQNMEELIPCSPM